MGAGDRSPAGCGRAIRWTLAQHRVEDRAQLVVVPGGEGARPVLRLERLPARARASRIGTSIVQLRRALPELVEGGSILPVAFGGASEGRSRRRRGGGEAGVHEGRRVDRPEVPARLQQVVRVPIANTVRIPIVAHLVVRKIDESDALAVRCPR